MKRSVKIKHSTRITSIPSKFKPVKLVIPVITASIKNSIVKFFISSFLIPIQIYPISPYLSIKKFVIVLFLTQCHRDVNNC